MPEHCPAGADYSQPCPIGWYPGTHGDCTTDDVALQCDERITASANRMAKAAWETACKVRWPCKKTTCLKDYSANCPVEWTEIGSGLCAAPRTYQGPCSRVIDLRAYRGRSDLKSVFELRCAVSWICKTSTDERERDFSVPCPLGWTVLEDGSCRAPPSYIPSENCPRIVSFVGRSPNDRQAYAALCEMDFPFRGEEQLW